MKSLTRILLTVSIFLLSAGAALSPNLTSAYANTTPIDSSYNSVIISDAAFTNTSAMKSATDVQNFLNAEVPVCDTNHPNTISGSSEKPPWVCLKDYTDPSHGTAAQIIYNQAIANGLNPEVILVTLQKENSLITDTWPFTSQYKTAMGYGCPDGGNCNADYYGFYNQVHLGAMLLREGFDRSCGNTTSYPGWGDIPTELHLGHTTNPSVSPYRVDGRATFIGSCATGSLYNYTPHRPDSAWLTAASDGQYYYGNYNFITYFLKWFPETYGAAYPYPVTASLAFNDPNPVVGETVNAAYTVKNMSDSSVTIDLGLADQTDNGNWNSFPPKTVTIAAGATATYTGSRVTSYAGYHRAWICVGINNVWYDARPQTNQLVSYYYNVRNVDANLLPVSASIGFSDLSPAIGETLNASYAIKNLSGATLTIDAGLADQNTNTGQWNSFTSQTITIPGNTVKQVSFSKKVMYPGPHRSWVAVGIGGVWHDAVPLANQLTSYNYVVRVPNIRLNYYAFDKLPPKAGQKFNAYLSVTNLESHPIAIDSLGVPIFDVTDSTWNTMLYSKMNFTLTPSQTLAFSAYQTLAKDFYNIWPSACTTGYCFTPLTKDGIQMFWAGMIQ
jgi:hypothetical protein